ncbi:hydroxymethylpyrimidine/phosphomethylpyrimidine kinase [Fructobacillus americanaquae]|uniref:pyridoxal kinase n=1 Tax=Fructobacillus americanaquae TaxID=2940302 RepID=A0ABY5C021_9LACO|nr:hydroxymethylpyrimidine/phosphomethylpyrimidine kinase [Fructobacillus americanaquae]USS92106.1 hydroxymethylpyrimidine/phosphomethylpyrimidine kinase [Fructobacillus americanaquae]
MATNNKVLTIAGSDSLAGGGLQADLATFAAAGLAGFSAITSIVSIQPSNVAVFPVPDEVFDQQLKSLAQVTDFAAIKVGMLTSVKQLDRVVAFLQDYTGPIVVDPVLVLKEGHLAENKVLVQGYLDRLLPLATVTTPNLNEGLALADQNGALVSTSTNLAELAKEISQRGQTAVFLKGGQGFVDHQALDVLTVGGHISYLSQPALGKSAFVNGAGCTLAAAITAKLALGEKLPEAVEQSQCFVHQSIQQGYRLNASRTDGNVFQIGAKWWK